MKHATISDAPAVLNTSDKAMWVLGYNAALDAMLPMQAAGDVGYTTFDYGCNHCPTEFVNGKPVRQRIVARGNQMVCVKCGGNYGPAPSWPTETDTKPEDPNAR